MKKYNVAILGATGAVGQEFLNLIEERNFPFNELKLLYFCLLYQEYLLTSKQTGDSNTHRNSNLNKQNIILKNKYHI